MRYVAISAISGGAEKTNWAVAVLVHGAVVARADRGVLGRLVGPREDRADRCGTVEGLPLAQFCSSRWSSRFETSSTQVRPAGGASA